MIDLLYINVIVALIWNSGFFDAIDEWISKKVRFHHLPTPFFCSLCGCWWLSLLWVIVTDNLSMFNICLCIVSAYMTDITWNLYKMIENIIMRIIMYINHYFDRL